MSGQNVNHGGGIRYENGGIESYCRVPGCKWVGATWQRFEDARTDGREHKADES